MADSPQSPKAQAQAIPQGGMMVPTQQGPQSQVREQSGRKPSEATLAEQKAGKEAIQKTKDRLQQEQEQGAKLVKEG